MVLRLRKSLYGLNQSSRMRYGTFTNFVVSIGFVASCIDIGMFVLHDKEDHSIFVAVAILYVDDLLIIANEGLIGLIKNQMKKRFRMNDVGSVSSYVGINIEHSRKHQMIDIHQHSYIRTILAKFIMDESRRVATPMGMKKPAIRPYTNR
jgi:hypothetical protein